MYTDTWVVVADAEKARFLLAVSNQELQEAFDLVHPKSRLKGEELETDRPGRSFDSRGPGRHHVGSEDLHAHEVELFASEISNKLYELQQENKLKQLFLVAPAKILGAIGAKLHDNVKDRLKERVDKNLTSADLEQIRSILPYVL